MIEGMTQLLLSHYVASDLTLQVFLTKTLRSVKISSLSLKVSTIPHDLREVSQNDADGSFLIPTTVSRPDDP